jgi:hypothetical protein
MRRQSTLTIAMGLMGISLCAAVSVPSVASADPYGTAGCGLGSMLFKDKPGIIQIFAATTNGTFGTQTFGITSGTSNCESTKSGTASAKAFIQANREAFAKDIARGNGETIANLSALAGCKSDALVGATLQQDFKQIFPSEQVSDIAVSDSVVSSLRAHPELACGDLT